jgi:hypothetical protein
MRVWSRQACFTLAILPACSERNSGLTQHHGHLGVWKQAELYYLPPFVT